ncbi:hypothetical protein K4K54_002564 [Colletotrichum sp. SAR 10_86]|nr:hypothetical protein K4K51_010579 [Colletotrichum sp. SAR 10_75]KAI8212993.1 hypothetical protein K4K52_006584 [Colletotrichum sp. SAR 10_76]KAI8229448.1 hypothetical protein K4K53_005574 [Colletotrichum sp. SAR 10_77]KAI8236680.1 hypothetical protein K4K54_002564 [Colletotrichum sp. SAR 10_86]KAJ5006537.1 hypothetical protein K4K48_003097 [Colletotrichum sp. SAR 10_66]
MKRFVQNNGSYKEELIWSNLFRIGADTSNKFKDSPKKNLLDKMAQVISDTRKGLPIRLSTLDPMLLDQNIIHYNRTQQMVLVDDSGNRVATSTAAINTHAPEPAEPISNNPTRPVTEDNSQASNHEVSDSSFSRKRFHMVEEEGPSQKKPKHTLSNYDSDNEQFSDFDFNIRNDRLTTNRNIASGNCYGQRIASSNMPIYGSTTRPHNTQEALMLDFFMDLGYDPRPRMRNQAPRQ